MTVSDKDELNDAIACYNAATTPGESLITLADDILLTASTTVINNTTPGVSLRIDGATPSVDGQEISGVRPFEIATNTLVTMQTITITRGNVFFGGGIFNGGTLTVTHSTLSHNTAEGLGDGVPDYLDPDSLGNNGGESNGGENNGGNNSDSGVGAGQILFLPMIGR